MKQQIKELVLTKIQLVNKSPQDISTYAITRANNGIFGIKIYWRGKTTGGSKRSLDIDLTFDYQSGMDAIPALEEIMESAKLISLDMNQPTIQTKTNKEW